MKVTIDRASWACGNHSTEDGALLTESGNRCCLGFLGRAIGLDDDEMGHFDGENPEGWIEKPMPSDLAQLDAWPSALFLESGHMESASGARLNTTDWEDVFARFNDWTGDIDDATRESWIATGFKIVLGCDVEFVGEYPS